MIESLEPFDVDNNSNLKKSPSIMSTKELQVCYEDRELFLSNLDHILLECKNTFENHDKGFFIITTHPSNIKCIEGDICWTFKDKYEYSHGIYKSAKVDNRVIIVTTERFDREKGLVLLFTPYN